MSTPKSMIAAVLCGSLIWLSACGSAASPSSETPTANNTGTTTQGRYVEQVVTPPSLADGQELFFAKATNGELFCYNADLTQSWYSSDYGATWQQSENQYQLSDIAYYQNVTLLADGSLLVQAVSNEAVANMTYTTQLYRLYPNGSSEPVQLNGIDGTGYFNQLLALDNNQIFIDYVKYSGNATTTQQPADDEADSGQAPLEEETAQPNAQDTAAENEEGPQSSTEAESATSSEEKQIQDSLGVMDDTTEYITGVFDLKTGQQVSQFNNLDIMAATTNGQTIYTVDYSNNVTAYNTSGTQQGNALSLSGIVSEELFANYALSIDDNGTLWLGSENGIYKLENNAAENVIAPAGLSIGNPNYQLQSLSALADGSFIAVLYTANGLQLCRYYWDENARLDEAQSISVWALEDSPTVRAAISQYMVENPEGLVEFTIGRGNSNELSASDAIRNLNNAILSGNSPDVIMLDGTPIKSYINKGVLAKLDDIIDTSGYQQNLLTQCQTDDGLYYLPMRAMLPLIAANEGYMPSDLASLTQAIESTPGTAAGTEPSFDWLPAEERSTITFDNFDELWEIMWQANAPYILENSTINTQNLQTFLENVKAISDHYSLAQAVGTDAETQAGSMAVSTGSGAVSTITGSPMAQILGRSHVSLFNASDTLATGMIREYAASQFANMPTIGGTTWCPTAIAGISSGSTKQEYAAAFINIMLSDTIQSARLADGLPVTQSGLQAQIDSLNQSMEWENPALEVADYATLLQNADTISNIDAEITDKLYTPALAYCQNKADLATTISSMQQAVQTYLAEREV